ncbi:dihydroorotase [Gimibacter soli]|uniref:Dihydroorotase n=1 Tax=Gimibacter soli TaxID=3024400 RepID=A0AAE9XR66_9PROT|nr:dihydroorotase [Gimibacter soli]WCL55707.1 dihydroorotase [Gimibacter soli]
MSITAYTNARLMDPASGLDEIGTLTVEDGRILAVGAAATTTGASHIVDCKGRVLAPGLVDMRAHQVDTDAAAAGGITTVVLQPDQTTVIDTDAPVERIRRRAKDYSSVRVYPMGAATKGMHGEEIAEIGQMQEAGAVAFTDCRRAIANAQVLRRLLEYANYFGALIVQFPEEGSLAASGVAHEGEVATRLGLAGVPVEAEVIQIERDARLAEMTDSRLHFALISSAAGVEAVRAAKKRGARVTAATAPHYLHLNENAVEGYRTFAKVSPPLRTEEDRKALIDGIKDGTIDVIVSDHDPRSEDVKRLPFAQASAGISAFETLLPLALAPVHAGSLDLMTVLKAMTFTPAKLLGLSSGTLNVGANADFVIFDPAKPWRVDRSAFLSKARNTPFDTLPVQGRVWRTIVAGKPVYTGEPS